jgi:hemolysin activation/secretion protein
MRANRFSRLIAGVFCCLAASAAGSAAQSPNDRADPSVIEDELRDAMPSSAPVSVAPPARAPQSDVIAAGASMTIGAIRVDGATALPPSAFAPVAEAYAGRALGVEELKRLASDIADVARRTGYGLATAWIPQQRVVNGLLRVRIDEGRIDAIEAEGSAADVVRRALEPIADGRPIRTAELERRLLLAGDIAGVRIGKPKLVRRGERSILLVSAARDRIAGRAQIDNWGTGTVGPVRLQLSADVSGLLAEDDRLSVGGVVTPLQPNEFGLLRIEYTKPVGVHGTEISLGGYAARSRPGAELSGFDYRGRSFEASASIRHPFARSRAASLWGELKVAVRDAEQTRSDVLVRDDRLATLTASAIAAGKVGEGRGRARISLVQGLSVFGATGRSDSLASRADASGRFSKLEVWAHYDAPLGAGFSIQAQGEGQIATRPLLSSEEMGLGGRSFLRGYDYRERSGDKGAAAAIELRRDFGAIAEPLSALQLYLYADAGSVGNYDDGSGGGTLASGGGGMRLRFGPALDLGGEIGVPIGDDDEKGPRFSFTIGSRF